MNLKFEDEKAKSVCDLEKLRKAKWRISQRQDSARLLTGKEEVPKKSPGKSRQYNKATLILTTLKKNRDRTKKNDKLAHLGERQNYSCIFFTLSHWNDKCKQHIAVAERKSVLIRRSLCLKSLRRGCATKGCKSSIKCIYCKQGHNRALCEN